MRGTMRMVMKPVVYTPRMSAIRYVPRRVPNVDGAEVDVNVPSAFRTNDPPVTSMLDGSRSPSGSVSFSRASNVTSTPIGDETKSATGRGGPSVGVTFTLTVP